MCFRHQMDFIIYATTKLAPATMNFTFLAL
jgi:hypothetical protein